MKAYTDYPIADFGDSFEEDPPIRECTIVAVPDVFSNVMVKLKQGIITVYEDVHPMWLWKDERATIPLTYNDLQEWQDEQKASSTKVRTEGN